MDKDFIANLLFAFDERINNWLHDCSSVSKVLEITLEFKDFECLLTKIQLNDFNMFLPSTIKRVAEPNENQDDPPCLKYHVKSICYDDCAFKSSHCQLTKKDNRKLKEYAKILRGE